MNRLDSGYAQSNKLIGATLTGAAGLIFFAEVHSGAARDDVTVLVFPIVFAIVAYFCMKYSARSLMDEVYDAGDCLLVKNDGQEDLIRLSDIMNVSVSTSSNPARITLRLSSPSKFGTEICFSPASGFTLNPFAKNKIGEDLITRVHQARSRRAI